jgi:hypothetical protein
MTNTQSWYVDIVMQTSTRVLCDPFCR